MLTAIIILGVLILLMLWRIEKTIDCVCRNQVKGTKMICENQVEINNNIKKLLEK